LLKKPNLIIIESGTLNKQERTINIGDPESSMIISFENNQFFDTHYFISSYKIGQDQFEEFRTTGNIGLSPNERMEHQNVIKMRKSKLESQKLNERAFYRTLPADAQINNE
jgi:hypothetical protein